MSSRWQVLRRAVLGSAVLVTLLAGPGLSAASAHATIVSTSPGSGSAAAHLPGSVSLVFDEPVQAAYAVVTLRSPDGSDVELGRPQVEDNQVSAAVSSDPGLAGRYEVSWRVVSADGHPVDGTFAFTVSSGGSVSSGGTTQDGQTSSAMPNAVPDEQPFLIRHAVVICLGVLVVGFGLLLAGRERRRATDDPSE